MRRSRSTPEHFVQLLGLELVALLAVVVLGAFKVPLNEPCRQILLPLRLYRNTP